MTHESDDLSSISVANTNTLSSLTGLYSKACRTGEYPVNLQIFQRDITFNKHNTTILFHSLEN